VSCCCTCLFAVLHHHQQLEGGQGHGADGWAVGVAVRWGHWGVSQGCQG
jgi:hypothetical protein